MPKLIIAKSANEAFIKLASELDLRPDCISCSRGMETREILGTTVVITNPFDRLITNVHRKISLKYLVGEWLWYERGSNSLDEIAYYSKFWRKISDDGRTANSAYGHRIFGAYQPIGFNQWDYAKKQLEKDRDTRRAVIELYLPSDAKAETKDLPCTMSLQFMIRNNALSLIVSMRSNDLFLGFAYDASSFMMFQEKMLLELTDQYPKLKMGQYIHFAASLHVYKKHYQAIKEVLSNRAENVKIKLPRMKNLDELKSLQINEAIIREGKSTKLTKLNDKFCLWCQDILMDQ